MASATEEVYIQKLNELILDENKIVTCMSACLELNISVIDAKLLLGKYLKNHNSKKPDELAVTYLISGRLKSDDSLAVNLVKENEMSLKKEMFNDVSNETIYSIQKGKNVDYRMLALSEQECNKSVCLGSVISKNSFKIESTQKKEVTTEPVASTSIFSTAKKTNQAKVNTEKKPEEKKEVAKPKPASGIANFFTKGAAKPSASTKKNNENIEPKTETKAEVKKEEEKKTIEPKVSEKKEESKRDSAKENEDKTEKKKAKTPQSNKKKRKKQSDKSSAPAKKRKRIQQISDSDSSDMFGESEEDIIEKSDDEMEIEAPVQPVKPVLTPKNKKRKAVDKTYMDEEGYMVTTTEYVYESASEEEQSVPAPEKPVKSTTPKAANVSEKKGKGAKNKKPVSGKQPTIMSFFQKK